MARYVLPIFEIRRFFLGESQLPRENSTDKSIQSFLLFFLKKRAEFLILLYEQVVKGSVNIWGKFSNMKTTAQKREEKKKEK